MRGGHLMLHWRKTLQPTTWASGVAELDAHDKGVFEGIGALEVCGLRPALAAPGCHSIPRMWLWKPFARSGPLDRCIGEWIPS